MNPKRSYHLGLCRYTFNIHKFPEPEILLEDIIIDANDIETIQVQCCPIANFAAQRSGAIVQKPEGPNTYDSKNPAIAIW